ncbi:lipopolysaccharide kinase InaA family protein [Porticoccus sp.]
MKKHFFELEPELAPLFQSHGLGHFSACWEADIALVDEPNRARGGWSEVGVLALQDESRERRFYLKRQENFNCQTLANPLHGIPVALRERRNIQRLVERGIATLDVVCCGREYAAVDRVILITEALDNFCSMDEWLPRQRDGEMRKTGLLELGRLVGRLHAARMKHGCLYPKHVYFSLSGPLELRLIDLEKCKCIFRRKGCLRDLETLLRHSPLLTPDDQQLIYAGYMETCPYAWTAKTLEAAVKTRIQAKRSSAGG